MISSVCWGGGRMCCLLGSSESFSPGEQQIIQLKFRKLYLVVNARGIALGFFITCILILLDRVPARAMYLLPFQGVPPLLKHNLFELAKVE